MTDGEWKFGDPSRNCFYIQVLGTKGSKTILWADRATRMQCAPTVTLTVSGSSRFYSPPVIMGRRQSKGLLEKHLENRVLMFPSVTSMVVASTIFNMKNGLLNKGGQRLPSDSVIRKRPSVAVWTDRTVFSERQSPRTSTRLLTEKIIRFGKG
jgi:hypothetical protein